MSRRRKITVRAIAKDPLYGSFIAAKLINKMMVGGKKSLSEKIVYGALDKAGDRLKKAPLEVLEKFLENTMPTMEIRSRKVGGATYQVPVEVSERRQLALVFQWLVKMTRGRKGKSMIDILSGEFFDACNGTGKVVKKRDEVHRMAEANRAFVHFRW